MDRQKVASELVKIAKSLVGDDSEQKAIDIVDSYSHKLTPYVLRSDFGLSLDQANAILDAMMFATGPGGKGRKWALGKIVKILKGNTKRTWRTF